MQHGFERCEHQEKLSKGHMKRFCSNFVIFFGKSKIIPNKVYLKIKQK